MPAESQVDASANQHQLPGRSGARHIAGVDVAGRALLLGRFNWPDSGISRSAIPAWHHTTVARSSDSLVKPAVGPCPTGGMWYACFGFLTRRALHLTARGC